MTDVFRVALIGCGTIFPMHARSLLNTPDVEISAVCDIKPERARRAAAKYDCRAYADYRAMLKKERPDAVHILTPHYLHPSMAIYALKNKINVLSEKPVSIDPADGLKMLLAARSNKVKLAVMSQNRYNPGSQLVKKHMVEGALGKITAAKLAITYHKPDSYYQKSDWKGRMKKEGGGVLIDQAIHFLDVLTWLINDQVEYVEGNCARRMHKSIEVEDLAEGVVKFRKGSYICFYLMNFYSYNADPEIEMDCEKARVKIVKDRAWIGFCTGKEVSAKPDPNKCIDYGEGCMDYWGSCHWVQIKNFYQALKEGRQPDVSPEEAVNMQKIVWNIYKSARTGKRIYFN